MYVIFDLPTTVSMIKLWNYAKTPHRGVKEFGVSAWPRWEGLVVVAVVPQGLTHPAARPLVACDWGEGQGVGLPLIAKAWGPPGAASQGSCLKGSLASRRSAQQPPLSFACSSWWMTCSCTTGSWTR